MKTKRKGFTLIELIVVMAIIAILVLIAAPKFMGYTEKAKLTQVIHDIKVSEKAAEQYYIENDLWPRDQTATPYTVAQLNTWVSDFKNLSGETVTLEPGDYYDVDWELMKPFMAKPNNNFKYIIQNPVGDIYYANVLTAAGEATKFAGPVETTEPTTEEVTNPPIVEAESLDISVPNANTNVNLSGTLQLTATVLPANTTNKTVNWSVSDNTVATINSDGLLTPIKIGNVTVTATLGSFTKTMNISVNNMTVEGQFMIVELYDYHVYSNPSNVTAVINELDIFDSNNNPIAYTLVSAYDSATNALPAYWSQSIWNASRMNDNVITLADGEAAAFLYNDNYTSPNQGKWARILINMGSVKTVSNVTVHLGSPYGRTPQKLTFYLANSYAVNDLKLRDDNIPKFGEIIVPGVKTTLTSFSVK